MVDNDIMYIKDLMKTDKSFYTYTEICNKYSCNINVMQFIVRGPFVQTLCIEKDSYMDAI